MNKEDNLSLSAGRYTLLRVKSRTIRTITATVSLDNI